MDRERVRAGRRAGRPPTRGPGRRARGPLRPWPAALLAAFLLALLLPAVAPVGAAEPRVTGIRFGTHGETTRLVVDIDRRLEPVVVVRDEPPRLVLDLPEVRFRVREHPLGRPRGLVTGHRFGRLEPGRSRIVVDLRAPFRIARRLLLPPSASSRYWRFVLDLAPVAEPSPREVADRRASPPLPVARPAPGPPQRTAATEPPPPRAGLSAHATRAGEPRPAAGRENRPSATPVPRARPATAAVLRRPVIVIDPGHGGIDPGTIGVNGELEKNLTLAMAKTLRHVLRRSGRYEVRLTREDDRFLPLRERIAIARRHRADLFVSLHADSIADRSVRGASVYTLSEKASDAEAERLARKENRVDVLAGVDLSGQDEIVAEILIDLVQRDTSNKSIVFADTLIGEIGEVTRLLRRTRRYAGFAVLKSPDTPSVLLELGYLSNPCDAARLADARHRERLAEAIARAIDRYFDNLRPPL